MLPPRSQLKELGKVGTQITADFNQKFKPISSNIPAEVCTSVMSISMSTKRCYDTEACNLNFSSIVNTVMYRNVVNTRAEDNHIATVCALSLYTTVRTNIAVH
jgi:hypothetical protein